MPLQSYFDIGSTAVECLTSDRGSSYEVMLNERYIDFVLAVMQVSGKFSDKAMSNFFKSQAFQDDTHVKV